jgi:hypothetical protein
MIVLAACSSDPVANTPGSGPIPGQNPGGGTSTSGSFSALLGTWRTQLVVQVPGDIQTWTTTWTFESDGTCHQTKVTESLAEGIPRTSERDCSFTVNGSKVNITFTGGEMLSLEYSFAGFSPNRLVLDSFEYARVA